MQGGRDVVELQDVGERAEHDRAGDRADHRARAAEEAGAADDDGGDGGQLVAGAVVGAAEVELAGMDDAGERRGKAGDRVDGDLDQRNRHAGKARRALVAADGEDVAAEARGVEHDGRDDGEDDEDDGRDGTTLLNSRSPRTAKTGGARPGPSP